MFSKMLRVSARIGLNIQNQVRRRSRFSKEGVSTEVKVSFQDFLFQMESRLTSAQKELRTELRTEIMAAQAASEWRLGAAQMTSEWRLGAAQMASEGRLMTANKELRTELMAAQAASEWRLGAAQMASEWRLGAAQKEMQGGIRKDMKLYMASSALILISLISTGAFAAFGVFSNLGGKVSLPWDKADAA